MARGRRLSIVDRLTRPIIRNRAGVKETPTHVRVREAGEGWQPIETAPRNGTVFDAWLGDAEQFNVDFYCSPGTRRSPDWYWLDGRFRPYIVGTPLQTSVVPTHWRPRPLPPTSTPEDKLIRDLDRAPASLTAERGRNDPPEPKAGSAWETTVEERASWAARRGDDAGRCARDLVRSEARAEKAEAALAELRGRVEKARPLIEGAKRQALIAGIDKSDLITALALLTDPVPATDARGIYIASKAKHGPRWQAYRAAGVPIISTWIDESGEGQTGDYHDLWRRCVTEAANADVTVVYHEDGEILKGALVEVGAALSHGRGIVVVGDPPGTWMRHRNVLQAATIDEAFTIATARAAGITGKGTSDD